MFEKSAHWLRYLVCCSWHICCIDCTCMHICIYIYKSCYPMRKNQLPRWSACTRQADAEVWVVQTSTEWAAECLKNGMPEEEAPQDIDSGVQKKRFFQDPAVAGAPGQVKSFKLQTLKIIRGWIHIKWSLTVTGLFFSVHYRPCRGAGLPHVVGGLPS